MPARLRRERYGACPGERAGELGEDRQVSVEAHPIKATDAERREGAVAASLMSMVALLAVALMCSLGGAAAASQHARRRVPMPPGLGSAQVRRTVRAFRRHQAELRSPAARRQRKRSRVVYRYASARVAWKIDHGHFEGAFDSPAYRGLELRPGERLHGYTGDRSALIDLPGGKRGIAESVLPLLTSAPGGGKVPVDLSLRQNGQALEPVAPLVAASFAGEARGGFSLPGVGITVRPATAASSSASQVEEKVFYPNVLRDTDLLTRPAPYGVETYSLLRSANSPEDLTFSLASPAGASLRLVPGASGFPAGAAVTRDGKDVLVIPPAVAHDADGQPVPVTYAVNGNDLIVHVPHRSGSYRYPVLVDPGFNVPEQFYSTSGWQSGAVGGPYSAYSGSYYYGSPVPNYGWRSGLIVQANVGTYQLNSYGNLWYTPPANSYIYRGEFQYVTYGWLYQAVNQGIWNPNGQPAISRQTGTNLDNNYLTMCAPGPNPTCDPGNGTDNNIFVLGLQNIYLTNTYYNTASAATMQSALIYERDRYAPQVTALSQNAPSGWVDASALSATATGSDTGLGMKEFAWVQPDRSQITSTHGCSGAYGNRCPSSWSASFNYNTGPLPEGVDRFAVAARDVVSNGSAETPWTVKVDHSPPSSPALSGTLWDHRNQTSDHRNEGLYDPSYTLGASSGDAFSGLKSIDVQVRNNTPYHYTARCSGTDGCSDSIPTWTFNTDSYSDGDHTITVTAKDQLADQPGVDNSKHVSTTSFQVAVDRRGDIYHAFGWSGDPGLSSSDQVHEEWAQINTQNARTVAPEAITTRNVESCLSDPQGCAVVRNRSQDPANPAGPEHYNTDTGTSHNDARFTDVSQLLAPANTNLGPPTATGPIQTALQPWQTAPPAHGSTYDLYVTTQQVIVDGGATDQTHKLWIDTTTRMPLRELSTEGTTVTSDVLYTYDRGRRTAGELPADQFSVGTPSNPGEVTTTQELPPVALPPPADVTKTHQELVDDSIAFRQNYGLNADPAYVDSIVSDPTLDGSIDEFGVPLTAAELADMNHRVDAESRLTTIDDYGANQAAADYAGLYIDPQHGGLIYVGFTANAARHMQDLQALYPYPELLRTFPTAPTRTYAALSTLADQVTSDWNSGTLDADNVSGVNVNEETNTVDVSSPTPTPVAAADLQARYGSAVRLIERSLSASFTAATYPIPPYLGGLEIHRPAGQAAIGCESGFGAVRRSSRAIRYYDVSAGHCIGSQSTGYGVKWYHGGFDTLYGTTRGNTFANGQPVSNTDGLSIQVSAGGHGAEIFLRSGHQRRITGEITNFHVHPKQTLCIASQGYGRPACGQVVAPDRQQKISGRPVRHIVIIRTPGCWAREGDSGAPVYRGHLAAGIVSGGASSSNGRCGRDSQGRQTGDLQAFSPITPVLAGLSLQLHPTP
jgi:hypothetical protein